MHIMQYYSFHHKTRSVDTLRKQLRKQLRAAGDVLGKQLLLVRGNNFANNFPNRAGGGGGGAKIRLYYPYYPDKGMRFISV